MTLLYSHAGVLTFIGGRITVNKIVCPLCAREINPIEYGNGRLWICCGKVVHNAGRLDEPKEKQAEGDSQTRNGKT